MNVSEKYNMARVAKILATILTITVLQSLFVNMDNLYRTGMKNPTAQELIEIKKRKVVNVKASRLAIERKNQELKVKGKPLLDLRKAASETDEVTIEINESATGGAVSDVSTGTGGVTAIAATVDNSQLVAFPPIGNQANESSCIAWVSTYYQMSHEVCLVRGCDNKVSDATRFSPRWTYNMINDGKDAGSSLWDAIMLLSNNGAVSLASLPYTAGDYRQWARTPELWREAINYKMNPYAGVSVTMTPSGSSDFDQVKQILANGHVLSIGTYISSWQFTTVGTDPTSQSPFAGQHAAYAMTGTSGGHGMVLVGYDDNIWIDVNRNGVVNSGEKGAFKVANSWGAGWRNTGYVWLAYDAVYSTSAVQGGPTGKVGAFNNGASVVYYLTAKPSYTPALLAQFTVNNASRGNLSLRGGFSNSTGATPTSYAASNALQNDGGAYGFDGSTYAGDGTFVLDLSSGVVTTGSANYYLAASNTSTTAPLVIKDFRLINNPRATQTAASRLPASFVGSTQYVAINYDFASGASAPVSVINATMSASSSGVTYDFNGASSYDPNSSASITNYEWNFGDGSNLMTGINVSHLYIKQGTFNVTLKVTSSFGLSSISSYSVKIADDTAPVAPSLSATLVTTTAKGKRRQATTSVSLSWSGATDNVGVAKYQIYRNGALLTTTTSSSSYSDTSTAAGGLYSYYIIAVDAAGNTSAGSNTALIQR